MTTPEISPDAERLERLVELAELLEDMIAGDHTESGLQGVSGLVGQYQKALTDIAQLKAGMAKREATVLDELAAKRRQAPSSHQGRPARRGV